MVIRVWHPSSAHERYSYVGEWLCGQVALFPKRKIETRWMYRQHGRHIGLRSKQVQNVYLL